MGIGASFDRISDYDTDSNIKANGLVGKVLKVVDVNHLIIAIKHNNSIKRIFCKGKGYKLKNITDRNIAIGKVNCLINMSNSIVNINAHGINTTGQLVVEIFSNKFHGSINDVLLLESYIEHDDDILFT
tara:strand:+ start:99 stop:485 length:387 start_codon:yes stop_codon:yes gene_type:complete